MSVRKSQIIAELKLQGQSAFKSGLTDVGKSAKKLGSDLQAIRPITFDNGANQARKSWALTEEHQRAHFRVLERQAKTAQARMEALGGKGSKSGGAASAASAAGGIASAAGAGVIYNLFQDYLQGGGIRGIANNVPQVAEMVAKTPAIKMIGASLSAVVATAWAAMEAKNLYNITGDRFLASAGDRYGRNKDAAEKVNRARAAGKATDAAGVLGDAAASRQSAFGGYVSSELSGKERSAGYAEQERAALSSLKQERINSIEDPLERERASAEESKRLLEQNLVANRRLASEKVRIAAAEQVAAEARHRAIRSELDAQAKTARTPGELNREITLRKELAGVETRMNEARARASEAAGGMEEIRLQERLFEIESKRLDIKIKDSELAIQRQKEADTKEGGNAFDSTYRDYRRQKIEADRKLAEDKKTKDQTANDARQSLKDDQARAKLSPRRLQKFDDAQKLKSDTEELVKAGVPREEAARMAQTRQNMTISARNPGRIRGAGYQGEERTTGLGSTSFTGLDALNDMQPSAPNRRIQGAGRDKAKQAAADEKQKQGSPDQSLIQVLSRKLDEVKAAIDRNGPSRNDRARPISTTSR